MEAEPRVGVLVQVCPVEATKGELSEGKWDGTQSRMTPMPAQWSRSMSSIRPCGSP